MAAERKLVIPPPVQLPARRVIAAGTVLFAVAFVVLLTPAGDGHRSWLWTALAGAVLGIAGYLLTGRHRAQGRTR